MKKEELIAKLRANTHVEYDMPDMRIHGIGYADTLQQFVEMTKSVGGNVIMADLGDDLNGLVRKAYPEARVFASNVPEFTLGKSADDGYELRNPDTVAEASDLNGVDVGVVCGSLGVAENGCVWIPQSMKEKAMLFISECLVIVLRKSNVVDNMHEAYDRIEMNPQYNFGTFISGPSKTADIEQALVMGAQAARGVTVVLVD
mgnify:CR=1 FL=1